MVGSGGMELAFNSQQLYQTLLARGFQIALQKGFQSSEYSE